MIRRRRIIFRTSVSAQIDSRISRYLTGILTSSGRLMGLIGASLDLLCTPPSLLARVFAYRKRDDRNATQMLFRTDFERDISIVPHYSQYLPIHFLRGYFTTSSRVAQILWSLHFSPSFFRVFHNDSLSRSMTLSRDSPMLD